MLNSVVATGYVKQMGSGRTHPCLLECEDSAGNTIEVVVKYSSNLFQKEKNLAIEAVVAMLAADLGLPVPEPFVVELLPEFIDTIPQKDKHVADAMRASCPLAFGSAFRTGMTAWLKDLQVTAGQAQSAAEIAVFDQIIVNSDRLPKNPNLLFTGDNLMMIDHELSLAPEQVLFWCSPWTEDGLRDLVGRDKHIFARPYLDGGINNLNRFAEAWEALPEARFEEYLSALPTHWVYDEAKLRETLSYLVEAKKNIRTITANALKVFS